VKLQHLQSKLNLSMDKIEQEKYPTGMRFELTRAEPIGLAVQRLNHSATQSAISYDEHMYTATF
jgi:hypothetical protein